MASYAPASEKLLFDAVTFETRCREADIDPGQLTDLGVILGYCYDDIWFAVACLNELGLAAVQMRWFIITSHNQRLNPAMLNQILQTLVAAKHRPNK